MNAMYIIIGITFFLLGFGCGEINATKSIIGLMGKLMSEMKDNKEE